MNDLLGGQVQMGVFDVPILLPHIRSGKLMPLPSRRRIQVKR